MMLIKSLVSLTIGYTLVVGSSFCFAAAPLETVIVG
jgi:hypothetical protein